MVVRMSNNMISQNYLTGLNKALYKQTKAMEEIYTERRLNRPSDNPVDTVLDMRYKVNLSANEQYTTNTDTALSWMNTTHDAMNELNDILQRVRELVVSASKPNPEVAYDAVAEEIDELMHQAIQIGNTTIGDRYIFAGQADRGGAPYYLVSTGGTLPDGSTATVDTVVYSGDDNKISMVVSPGSANPSLDGVNITGNELFNNGKIFEDLIKIRDELRNPTPYDVVEANPNYDPAFDPTDQTDPLYDPIYDPGSPLYDPTVPTQTDHPAAQNRIRTVTDDPVPFLSDTAIGLMDEGMDKLLTTQARLSAKVSAYEFGQSLLESANIRITDNISKVEDVNVADATMAFTIAQNAYNAALAMGAKILPMSLVQYL